MGRLLPALLSPLAAVYAQAPLGSQAPPGWQGMWDFLVEGVCAGSDGRPLPGASPLDGAACSQPRKLAAGEALPYHKQDWPGVDDPAHPAGYQRSDSLPVQSARGPVVVQTFDFGDLPRRFGQFDPGDGGQIAVFSARTASFGLTEDGGAGLQVFLGPACLPIDSWVIVDRSFPAASSGDALAHLTREPSRCPARLGPAFTRWHVQPIRFRQGVHGVLGVATLTTLVSEHFGGAAVATADHLERMYFTRELGATRWERWQNAAVRNRAADHAEAARLDGSGRCEPGIGAPSPDGWLLVDCREWTQIVPPDDAAGDKPGFWLDRLLAAPAAQAVFGP